MQDFEVSLAIGDAQRLRRDYFETLFDMSCSIWFQIYSKSKKKSVLAILLTILFVCVN